MTGGTGRPAVLCAGRLYCDLIFTDLPRLPTMGTEVYAGGLGLHAGGGAFITAAYFASLGHRSCLASLVPAPPFRDVIVPELEAAGLELDLCGALDPAADPQVTVAMAGKTDRAFLTRRSGPAVPDVRAADLRRLGVSHVHIGELATLLECPWLVATAREAGATVSLDCGWDEDLQIARLQGLLPQVDVFLPNEAEVENLRERGVAEPFAPLTVIKKGAAGSAAIVDGAELTASADRVEAVDTTGAGDAFNAGFLSAWLAGDTIAACLRVGNALGARAISGRGGYQPGEFHRGPAVAGANVAG